MLVCLASSIYFFFFFFSSRRRHTRLQGDWSSDVCSSDLHVDPGIAGTGLPGLALQRQQRRAGGGAGLAGIAAHLRGERKSTRLNSSHLVISYAVFCLKKKKTYTHIPKHMDNITQLTCTYR